MPLRPAHQFHLALAALSLSLVAEGALLWKLSSRPSTPAPPIVVAAPETVPIAAPPLFTIPDLPSNSSNAPALNRFDGAASTPKTKTGRDGAEKMASGQPLSGARRAEAKALFEAANAALERKDNLTALANFRRVVQIAPDHLPTRLNLALLYLGANQPALAVPHLEKATQIAPNSAAPRFELARTLLRLKRPQDAIAPLQQVVRLAPRERSARVLLAEIYAAQKQPREALAQWSALAQTAPRDVPAHLQAAQFAALAGRPQEAEKWLRRAHKGAPRDPQAALVLGRLLLSKNRFKEAISVLSQGAKARPDVFDLFPLLADARLATGDLKGARGAVQSALLRLPSGKTAAEKAQIARVEGTLQLSLGRIWGQNKKPRQARIAFARAAALLPREAEPQSLLALAALQSGDKKAAQNALQSAVKLDPKRAGDRLLLAQLLAQSKNWSAARAQYAAYSQLQPRDVGALVQWAQVASEARQSEEELQIWAKLAALQPKNPAPLLQRGLRLRLLNRRAEALAVFQRALALRPAEPNALFEVARTQGEMKQFSSAAATWQRLLVARPDFVPAYSFFLQQSQRSGQNRGARVFLARQLSKGRENPRVLSEVLAFYSKSGQSSQAKALLADVVQRSPKARLARAALDSFGPATTIIKAPLETPTSAPIPTPVAAADPAATPPL